MSNRRRAGTAEPSVWHYHAAFECGHRLAFDLPQNLLVETLALDPGATYSVQLPCRLCGGAKRQSTELHVTAGRGPCPDCS